MNFQGPSARSSYRLLLTLGLLALALDVPSVSYTQSSGCPTTGGANGNPGWAPNSTVRYRLNSSITPAQQPQIVNGLTAWNTANQSNGSGIQFLAADATHPANVTFKNGNLGAAGDTAGISFQTTGGVITSATITFNTAATMDGTSTGPLVYQSGQPGYETVFQKMTEHEIGHSMGINDIPQGSGSCGGQTGGSS